MQPLLTTGIYYQLQRCKKIWWRSKPEPHVRVDLVLANDLAQH